MTATTWPRTPGYDDVVDLDRYPIGDPASPAYRELVSACQDQLREKGVAQLAGFLTPAAVSQMLALASQLAAQAWASDQTHTVYFEPADDSAGPDHPRALRQRSAKNAIAYDQIPAEAPIRRLYESDDLTAFIAAVLGKPVLYRSADPLDALEIAIFDDAPAPGLPRRELPRRAEAPAGPSGRRPVAAVKPGHTRGLPRRARPAPGRPGQRAAAADQLGADLRRASRHEADRAHPAAVLRPHRLTDALRILNAAAAAAGPGRTDRDPH
jgi:hypothetical protein